MTNDTSRAAKSDAVKTDSPRTVGEVVQNRTEAVKETVGEALERGKAGIAESASVASDHLADDLASLKKDMASIQATLAQFLSETKGEATRTAQDLGAAVKSQMSEAAADVAETAKDQVTAMTTELERVARQNPLGTIGASVLVGLVIGMMSRSRS